MSFCPSRYCSIVCLRMKIASVVLLPGMNPNWLSWIIRALSHPSIQYYLEGVRQELDPSVVLKLLDVALFLEDGTSTLSLQADGMVSVVVMLLNSLQRVTTPNHPRHFHTSAGISSLPTAMPLFMPLSALSVSASLMGAVSPWVGSLSSVSTLGFSSFTRKLKY